jgi:N-acetylmuramoyl-L-alanine amidase
MNIKQLLCISLCLMAAFVYLNGCSSRKNPDKEHDGKLLLKGKVICIDAGHQAKGNYEKEPIAPGSDVKKDKTTSGTAGVATKISEYKLNLEVAILLKERLRKLGAKIIMTRGSHNVNLSNIERAEIANKSNADLTVRIHADGAEDSKVRGASVLYPGNQYVKDDRILKQSWKAAESVAKQIEEIQGVMRVKTVQRNDLTGFNWSKVPVILVEVGFMSNPDEDKLITSNEFQQNMADAITKGVIDYFEDNAH